MRFSPLEKLRGLISTPVSSLDTRKYLEAMRSFRRVAKLREGTEDGTKIKAICMCD